MTRRFLLAVTLTAVVVVLAAAGVLAGIGTAGRMLDRTATQSAALGDCVVVTASGDQVQTRPAACTEDPSYTVGAMASFDGSCPSTEYQHFPGPAADRDTAALCLVPNLVADHCYWLGLPIGTLTRADCAAPRDDAGLLVKITQKLDVRNQRACPTADGQHAWPYPEPARTYCTATLY